MAKDVLITPSDGLIQFSSSAGTGSGQIKVDDDNLVISNLVGDVLLGDGASDIYIGDGTNTVDIIHEQNMIIQDDASGKNLTIGSKTTNVFVTGSSTIAIQKDGGNVGIGTTSAGEALEVIGNISQSSTSTGSFGAGFFDNKVGIGTTSPNNPLSVSGSLTVFTSNQTSRLTVGEADVAGESTSNSMIIETTGASNKSRIFTVGTSNDMVIETMGNTSDIHLSSDRDIRFGVNNNSAYNFTEKMIMKTDGTFGIGTSNPTEKLQVAGNISASGYISTKSHITASGVISASGGFVGDGSNISNVSATISGDNFATDLKIGRDADNLIDFTSDNQIQWRVNGGNELKLNNAALFPAANDGHALGSAAYGFSDLFFADGAVIGFNNGEIHLTQTDASLVMSGSGATTLEVLGNVSGSHISSASFGHGHFDRLGVNSKSPAYTLQVSGDMGIANYMYHNGDEDTHLLFDTNIINLVAGGWSGFKIDKPNGWVRINNTNQDLDFQVNDSDGDIMLHADAALSRIGINTATPSKALEVEGDISSSGHLSIQKAISVGSHITASGNISASGDLISSDLFIDSQITHNGDTDTKLTFTDNALRATIGNVVNTNFYSYGTKFDLPITASGNISASGQLIAASADFNDGNITNVGTIDVDTIRADAANNVNIALGTSGIVFNAEAGDSFAFNTDFANTDLTYYNADEEIIFTIDQSEAKIGIGVIGGAPAETLDVEGNAQVNGNVIVAGDLIHKGDTDTKIAFTTDAITMTAGGVEMLKLVESTVDALTINEGGVDMNVRVESSGNANMLFVDGGEDRVGIGTSTPKTELHVVGDISSSGFIGGGTQNTGSYDFPGAIMGYNAQGVNVTDASYSLTTSYAVPDADMYVTFVAPKSGIVEIEVQVYADGGTSGAPDLFLGLSDNASYNAVQTYYEVGVLGAPRYDHMIIVHKWVVSGLTAGTTYKYWLGAKVSSTLGTPTLKWGADTNNKYPPFIMKAIALPSNAEIET